MRNNAEGMRKMATESLISAGIYSLGLFRPREINCAMLGDAIPQIEVYQALVRNAGFLGHFFEILDDILAHANGYLLLEL